MSATKINIIRYVITKDKVDEKELGLTTEEKELIKLELTTEEKELIKLIKKGKDEQSFCWQFLDENGILEKLIKEAAEKRPTIPNMEKQLGFKKGFLKKMLYNGLGKRSMAGFNDEQVKKICKWLPLNDLERLTLKIQWGMHDIEDNELTVNLYKKFCKCFGEDKMKSYQTDEQNSECNQGDEPKGIKKFKEEVYEILREEYKNGIWKTTPNHSNGSKHPSDGQCAMEISERIGCDLRTVKSDSMNRGKAKMIVGCLFVSTEEMQTLLNLIGFVLSFGDKADEEFSKATNEKVKMYKQYLDPQTSSAKKDELKRELMDFVCKYSNIKEIEEKSKKDNAASSNSSDKRV